MPNPKILPHKCFVDLSAPSGTRFNKASRGTELGVVLRKLRPGAKSSVIIAIQAFQPIELELDGDRY
ncbi:MAG: hypothetical protein KME30_27395 [Iphinoe sp. HA4291-MV1]|nr:hypothetical protein [Iphinoe sp. HA4291-MV1]